MVNASLTSTTSAEPGRASDSRVIGLVSAAHFVSHVHILILPPLFLFMRRDYGYSYQELGLILASFNIVSAALQTPAGFLVDRWGAGRLLIGGLLLASGSIAAASFMPSYWGLVACFAVAGLGNTVYHPADYSILSHTVQAKRMGQAFSVHTFSGLLGTAAAPASMLFAAERWGWRGAILSAAVLGAVVALVLALQRRALVVTPHAPKARSGESTGGVGLSLLLSPAILRNLMFFALLSLASGGISGYSIVALGALHSTPNSVASLALTCYLFLSAFGVLLGGFIADRTRHHTRVAAIGFAVSAVVMLAIGTYGLGTLLLVLLMSVGGLLNGVIQPSRDMIVRAVTPAGSFGKVFGFVTTGFNVGGVVAPLAYGWLMDQGEPRLVFFAVAGITLLSLLTVITGPTRAPRPAAAE